MLILRDKAKLILAFKGLVEITGIRNGKRSGWKHFIYYFCIKALMNNYSYSVT